MPRGIDHQRFALLFVDDEEPTLRQFDKFFSRGFKVFTAPDVDTAQELLERHGDEIGVVISDQRMPGRRGVELLDWVRERHPRIVRILTTGYSDLQEAIDAVNRGEIFRYITKPWNPRALTDELMHALELHALRRERDLFVEEKLSVRQRQTQSERLRDLVAMAAMLPDLRRPLHAVRALLVQLADLAPNPPEAAADQWAELDHWGLMHKETRSSFELGRHVAGMLGGDTHGFDDSVDPLELIKAAEERESGASPLKLDLPDSLPLLNGNAPLLRRLFELLLDEARRLRGENGIELAAEALAEGLRFTLTLPSATLPPAGGTLLNAPPGADPVALPLHGDLLAAYLIAYHHGGSLSITGEDGLRLILNLPTDPLSVVEEPLDEEWIEEVLVRFEGWE